MEPPTLSHRTPNRSVVPVSTGRNFFYFGQAHCLCNFFFALSEVSTELYAKCDFVNEKWEGFVGILMRLRPISSSLSLKFRD